MIEINLKTERIMRMLAAENLGGVLLNSQANFAWATAGANNGVDLSRENGVASLFIRRDGKKFLLASKIEMARMLSEEVSATDFEPIEFGWETERTEPDFLAQTAIKLLESPAEIAADVPLSHNARVIEHLIAPCRAELMTAEIERYRKLGKDAGATLGELMKNLQPDEAETAIAARVQYELARQNMHTAVCLVAADERLQKFRHPVPTAKTWEKVLMVVVCVKRQGLVASLSRIVCTGEIPDELQRKTESCARVNAALLAATKPGATGAELYKIAADAYAAENFAGEINLHHQGGAAGYRTRDWTIHPTSADKVVANQAFAWNPSISGTKTEETVIAFADNIETLTASPGWAQISTEIDGREFLSPGILSL